MRTAFIIYWLIGCLIVGGAQALYLDDCPDAWHGRIRGADLFGAVAIWPAITLAVMMPKKPIPAKVCGHQ